MYDVQWSPIHPALFAAVDGTGRLDLWNLNNDTEVQIWTILFRLNARETHVLLPPNLHHFAPLQVPTASTHSESMTSLNRLRWTHSGHQIAVGDDDGHVFIYDVGEVRELKERMFSYWESNIRKFPLLQYLLLGKLPTYPSPKPTSTLTSHLG